MDETSVNKQEKLNKTTIASKLRKLADDLESANFPSDINFLSEIDPNLLFNRAENTDKENTEIKVVLHKKDEGSNEGFNDEELIRYLITGWYVYQNIKK